MRELVIGYVLAFLLGWAAFAFGEVDQLVVPIWGGSDTEQASNVANRIRCSTFAATFDKTFTKMTWGVTTGAGSGHCAIGIWPDADNSSAIVKCDAACTAAGPVSCTFSAKNLTAGLTYRLCGCASSTAIRFASLFDFAPSGMDHGDVLNASGAVRNGFANAETCSTGILPSLIHGLTATDQESFMAVLEAPTTTTSTSTSTTTTTSA